MRHVHTLRGVAAIFIIFAASALLWPPAGPPEAVAPAALAASLPAAPLGPLDPYLGQAVRENNIFSATRTAPARRYSPFEPERPAFEPPAPAPPEAAPGIAEVEGVPKLYGIIIGELGTAALLRLDPAVARAELYRAGDRGGVYRVVEVNEQSVVLSGPNGRVVLDLKRERSSR